MSFFASTIANRPPHLYLLPSNTAAPFQPVLSPIASSPIKSPLASPLSSLGSLSISSLSSASPEMSPSDTPTCAASPCNGQTNPPSSTSLNLQQSDSSMYSLTISPINPLQPPFKVSRTSPSGYFCCEVRNSCWGRTWKRLLIPGTIGIISGVIGAYLVSTQCDDGDDGSCQTGKICCYAALGLMAPAIMLSLARLGACIVYISCQQADDIPAASPDSPIGQYYRASSPRRSATV